MNLAQIVNEFNGKSIIEARVHEHNKRKLLREFLEITSDCEHHGKRRAEVGGVLGPDCIHPANVMGNPDDEHYSSAMCHFMVCPYKAILI